MKPIYILKAAAICSALFLSNNSTAQMVGGDVFLKGRYVEVGIGHLGYYGSDGAAPSGYHPHMGTKVGFVADPGMTGWSTGTGSHYMGDYFLPGTPFEGWVLEVNSNRCQSYNTGSSTSSLTTTGPTCSGANVSYTTSGSTVSGTWLGMFDSVEIKQITTLDTNQHYFTVKVVLTNLAVAPKNDIYYFRSLDPDNDQTWPGGSFITHNVVEHQATDTTVVSANGSISGSYLGLGTTDTAATALIYNSWPISISAPMATAYGGTVAGGSFTGPIGTDHYGDIAIGIVMYIPHLATVDSATDSVFRTTATPALHPANTATFNYFFSFSPGGTDSAIAFLNAVPPPPGALGIQNINKDAGIQVYPNPSKDMVSITNLNSSDHVSVYDLMGRDMGQNWQVTQAGTNTFRYNNLSAGAYVLLITDAGGNIKTRVPVRKQ